MFPVAMQAVSEKPFRRVQHKQPFFNPLMSKESY